MSLEHDLALSTLALIEANTRDADEQADIEALVGGANLSPRTATAVCAAITKILDHGRQLDSAQAEFKRIGDAIDTAERGRPEYDRLCEREELIAGRIDALRSMLGVTNG